MEEGVKIAYGDNTGPASMINRSLKAGLGGAILKDIVWVGDEFLTCAFVGVIVWFDGCGNGDNIRPLKVKRRYARTRYWRLVCTD